jgi:hypothetical protein
MYHLVYYRENAKQKTYHLFRVEHMALQVVTPVPDSLSVQALSKYQDAQRDSQLPLVTLATGKYCEVFTLGNWQQAKNRKRYEFRRREGLERFRPSDIHRRYVLVPFCAHLAWFQRAENLSWVLASEVFQIEAGNMLVPRQIHCLGRDLARLRTAFRNVFQCVRRKSKLLLIEEK